MLRVVEYLCNRSIRKQVRPKVIKNLANNIKGNTIYGKRSQAVTKSSLP
jgi:hypothetical protein